MAAQDARDAAQAEVDSIQGEQDQVEAEIEDVRQQIDDAERLMVEGGIKGAKEGKIFTFPVFGPLGKIISRANKVGQGAGGLEGSETAMEYLHNVLYPKRGELENQRQKLLKAKENADKAIDKAQSDLDQAANDFMKCNESSGTPPPEDENLPPNG